MFDLRLFVEVESISAAVVAKVDWPVMMYSHVVLLNSVGVNVGFVAQGSGVLSFIFILSSLVY